MWGLACFLLLSIPASAQLHNGECYRRLVADYFEKNGSNYQQLSGDFLKDWMPPYTIDTSGSSLFMAPPEITYAGIGKKQYCRSLKVFLNLQDSVMRSEVLTFSDTLSLKQVKAVRRASPKTLKGDTPGFSAKIARPMVIVASSIALIVALFYIRSQ